MIIPFFIIWSYSDAQNDTLFLYKDCYTTGDQCFNKVIDSKKEGKWLYFGFKLKYFTDLHLIEWTGFDSLGNDTSGEFYLNYVYKPLHNICEKVPPALDSYLNDTIRLDWIPPDLYYISSMGNYKNGLKQGKWISYFNNGQIKKVIKYKNGKVVNDFKLFRENGSVMFSISLKKDGNFKVCRYSESNLLLDCTDKTIEEIEVLLE